MKETNYWNMTKRKTLEDRKKDFIERAKVIHAGENLDYSEVEYVNNRTPVKIICHDLKDDGTEYGEFYQTPSNHLKGQTHPGKKGKIIAKKKAFTTDEVIELFEMVHADENLDYSEVKYVNMHTKVKIISHDLDENGNEYGEFWQEPIAHLKGCSHPRIGNKKSIAGRKKFTTDEIIKKLEKVHEGKGYDFSEVKYTTYRSKIHIICPKHGGFDISLENALAGKGCQRCGHTISKNENEIYEYVKKLLPDEKIIKRDRVVLEGNELDIYIPSLNVAIEYNGLKWHTEWFGGKRKYYHLNKTDECNKKGIGLLQIFEDEYVSHKDIVLSKISHILKADNGCMKVPGRKCNIEEVDRYAAEKFLNKNHIQGFAFSTVYLGAFYGDKLVAVMTFTKETEGMWNLSRFASDNSVICQGIGGKLFKHFVREYKPVEVKSFADRRWTMNSDNNLYTKLGFKMEYILGPEYRYFKDGVAKERLHKFNFRKQVLHRKYGFPLTMTETEMVKKLGYDRIWDCGLYKYVWRA